MSRSGGLARSRRSASSASNSSRWIVSPSGIPFHVATRGARETGRTEWLRQRGLVDRKAVDLVEEERGAAVGARLGRERGRDEPACGRHLVLVAVGEGQERAFVTREPRGERTVDEHDERARRAHG